MVLQQQLSAKRFMAGTVPLPHF
eukprot:SAG31_NODE_37551_length_303_cov_0.764706_1_plen_22_part_10